MPSVSLFARTALALLTGRPGRPSRVAGVCSAVAGWPRLRPASSAATACRISRGRDAMLAESLETRVMLTTTVFLDFGLGIGAGNVMTGTVDEFRNIFGAGINGNGTGSNLNGRAGLTGTSILEFSPLDYDYDGSGTFDNADIVALANDVVPIVERALEPFDIDVALAAATSFADALATVNANNADLTGRNDAYNFVMPVFSDDATSGVDGDDAAAGLNDWLAGIAASAGVGLDLAQRLVDPVIRSQADPDATNVLPGSGPSRHHHGGGHHGGHGNPDPVAGTDSVGGSAGLFGVAAADDLFTQAGNRQDEATLTFTDVIINSTSGTPGTADYNDNLAHRIAYTATHEAAHTFTYVHTTGDDADTTLLSSGDIIRLGSNTREDPFQIIRFDLDRQNDFPVAEPNNYLFAANDSDIGLRDDDANGIPDVASITGTGAHDRITLSSLDATTVQVLIEAFADAAMTDFVATESFTIDLTTDTDGTILLDAGINSDLIRIDTAIAADFAIRGGTGRDGDSAIDTIAFDGAVTSFAQNPDGTGSAIFLNGRTLSYSEIEALDGGSISGVVFDDANGDGIRDAGEAGRTDLVYIDIDGDGMRTVGSTGSADADGFGDFAVIGTAFAGVTLTRVVADNTAFPGGTVRARTSGRASTGGNVFAPGDASSSFLSWFNDRRLRVDFAEAVGSVSIDAISDDSSDFGNLEIFDAVGNSLGFYATADLGQDEVETMTLSSDIPIAYAVAWGQAGQTVELDNLSWSTFSDPTATPAADGSFTFDDVPVGSYDVYVELPSDRVQTTQGGGGPETVSVSPGEDVVGVAFGSRLDIPPGSPIVDRVSASVRYVENRNPNYFARAARVADADTTDFGGAVLTVDLIDDATGDPIDLDEDFVGLRDGQGVLSGTPTFGQGTGVVQIGVSGVGVFDKADAVYAGSSMTLTFRAGTTAAEIAQILRRAAYQTDSESPDLTPRTIRVTLTDPDGNVSVDTGSSTSAVDIVSVADPATLDGFLAAPTWTEGGGPVALTAGLAVSDVDTTDFGGARLDVYVRTPRDAGDVFLFDAASDPAITVSGTAPGSTVSINGTAVATLTRGATANRLFLDFLAGATAADVAQLGDAIRFDSSSDTPRGPKQVLVTLTDPDGARAARIVTLDVTPTNDAPQIANVDGVVSAAEAGGAAERVAMSFSLIDPDYRGGGGQLTVSVDSAATDGALSIATDPIGRLVVNGSDIEYQGTVVGTVTGLGTLSVTATFNASSSFASVRSFGRLLAFTAAATTPVGLYDATWDFTDEGGLAAPTATSQLDVITSAADFAPVTGDETSESETARLLDMLIALDDEV